MEGAIIMVISSILFVLIMSFFSKSDERKKRDALNNPNNLEDNLEMGIKLFENKKFDDALKFFNNINRNIKMDYTAIADSYRGIIYFDREEYLQARQAFESFIQNEGYLKRMDHAETIAAVNFLLGGIYFFEGRLDEAKYHKDRAISFDNSYSNAKNDIFQGYNDL